MYYIFVSKIIYTFNLCSGTLCVCVCVCVGGGGGGGAAKSWDPQMWYSYAFGPLVYYFPLHSAIITF